MESKLMISYAYLFGYFPVWVLFKFITLITYVIWLLNVFKFWPEGLSLELLVQHVYYQIENLSFSLPEDLIFIFEGSFW